MKIVITIILFIFLLLINRRESFTSYLMVDNDKKDFYMRFIDFVLTGKKPNYNYINGYPIINPQIITPNYRNDLVWMNPSNRIVFQI